MVQGLHLCARKGTQENKRQDIEAFDNVCCTAGMQLQKGLPARLRGLHLNGLGE